MLRATRASRTGGSSPVMKFSAVLVVVLVINEALAKPKAQGLSDMLDAAFFGLLGAPGLLAPPPPPFPPGPSALMGPPPLGPPPLGPPPLGPPPPGPSAFMGPPLLGSLPSGPMGPPPPGFTYIVQATKTTSSVQSEDVLSTDGDGGSVHNMTIHYPLDLVEPIFIEAQVRNSDADFSYIVNDVNSINACAPEVYADWEELIALVSSIGIFPPFKCPTQPGIYKSIRDLPPVSVTFSRPIACGDYTLSTDFFRKETAVFHAEYEFTIQQDGPCYNPRNDDSSDDDSQ